MSGLAACDLPTELPKWDTTWVVPGESTTISVASLLPSSITTSGNSFVLSLPATSITQTLGQMCPECSALNGFTVPKPAIDFSSSSSIPLPSGVNAVALSGGTLAVTMTHDFSFDPLRPGDNFGYILLTATSSGVTVARDSIPGQTTAFPPNSTITRNVPILPNAISAPITVNVRVVSPAGGDATIDTSDRLVVSVTPTQVQVSQTNIALSNRTITGASTTLDLEGVDDEVTDRVKSGALLLTLVNPFAGTTGQLNVRITTPTTVINKSVTLAAGTSTARVDLNQQEIQSILGSSPVTLSVTGTVSAPASGVNVTPSMVVAISSRLELTVGPKD